MNAQARSTCSQNNQSTRRYQYSAQAAQCLRHGIGQLRRVGMQPEIVLAAFIALAPGVAEAFKLQPVGTDFDLRLARLSVAQSEGLLARFVSKGAYWFSQPVHEEMTHRGYGCTDAPSGRRCAKATNAPAAVIDGVLWNDNPPFQMSSDFQLPSGRRIDPSCANETIKLPRRFDCWSTVFREYEGHSRRRYFTARSAVILGRSHFGDMQFLHSMASRLGDKASITRAEVLMWAEFTYKVAIGVIPANTALGEVPIKGLPAYFPRWDATVESLFLMGDPTYRVDGLKQFAFGSLLHMVQDSFSAAHVERDLGTQGRQCKSVPTMRAPAAIRKFSVYSAQDSKSHGQHDAENRLEAHLIESSPNVVDVVTQLRQLFDDGTSWDDFSKHLRCAFELVDDDAEADGGVAHAE